MPRGSKPAGQTGIGEKEAKPNKPADKKATGRPTLYTRELADEICRRLSVVSSLRAVCQADDMPAEGTVRIWALDDRDGFTERYSRARELGYHSMADEVLEIADDGTNDWVERKRSDGSAEQVVDHEHIARSRLRFDARRWLLSKALPKIYGDKLDLNSNTPLQVRIMSFSETGESQ